VATGALGTGVNIKGIVYIVHVDQPYRLTGFVQQSGRGRRNGEVSESIIITQVHQTSRYRRQEILSAYLVEAETEAEAETGAGAGAGAGANQSTDYRPVVKR
jgi:superfamily II DNA helicase RecQ